MNRFVRKLLAKYVRYIEIIGYLLVVLFIAGLIALSQIKAEDDYVALNGKLELSFFPIQFDQSHYIADILSDTNAVVSRNAPLLELTDDQQLITDRTLLANLETQLTQVRQANRPDLEKQLSALIYDLEEREYPNLHLFTLRTDISGVFLLFHANDDLIPANEIFGGVFYFDNCQIEVTELPADKRQVKKLAPEQTGTAVINNTISVNVKILSVTDERVTLSLIDPTLQQKESIAKYIASLSAETAPKVSLSILVGWKSWMNLIWR